MVPKCFTTKAFSFSVQLANCVRYWSPLPHRKHCLPWTSGLLVDSLLAVNILLYISLQLDYDVLEYNFFVYLGIQFFLFTLCLHAKCGTVDFWCSFCILLEFHNLYETKMYQCIPESVTTLTLSTFIFLASQLRCPPSHDRYSILAHSCGI